jgi:hypothetical protein
MYLEKFACIDSKLSLELHHWFVIGEEYPLPLDLFYNLLVNDSLYIDRGNFFEEDVIKSKHRKEYHEIFRRKNIKPIPYDANILLIHDYPFLTGADIFENSLIIKYCIEKNIPFKPSSYYFKSDNYSRLENYIQSALAMLTNKDRITNIEREDSEKINIAKWVITAHIPSVFAISEKIKNTISENTLDTLLKNNGVKTISDKEYENAMNILLKSHDSNCIYISPEVFIELIKSQKTTKNFNKFVNMPKLKGLSQFEVYEIIKESCINKRLEFPKQILFQLMDISIPFSGTISSYADKFLTANNDWVISFDKIDRRIRNKNHKY